MATLEAKAKAPKRKHLIKPASRGPKKIDYVGIDKAAHPKAKTLIAEWLPDNAERVKYDGRNGKWCYERKTGKHLTKLRMCIAGITRSEAAKAIAERLSISPHDATLKKNDDGLFNPPRTPETPPIAVRALTAISPEKNGDEFGTPPQPQQNAPVVALSVIKNTHGRATKAFSLDASGDLQKHHGGEIYEGEVVRREVCGIRDLLSLVEGLKQNEALCYGITENPHATLVTQDTLKAGGIQNAIARDRKHFSFRENAPGVMMLDHDPRPGHKRLDWSELDRILCENVTGFAEVERVWRPSSSSYLYRQEDGKELIGVGGWRCYVIVYDAASIPSVGAFIYQRLWAAGYGYVEVSKSGQFLDRCLVDAAVWQPERLDFAAAPVLKPGIQRRAPEAVILPGAPMLFSSRITATFTMPEWRKASKDLQLAKDAMRPKAETVRQQFLKDKIVELRAAGSPIKDRRAKEILTAAVTHNVLSSDFPLRTAEGENITVGDILATPERFDGTRFADPLEPDYRNDHRIAFANLSAEPPYIFSHAHGGWTYRLYRESADILIERGELPRAVDETLEVMASRGDMYERAGELVRLNSETVAPVNCDYLADYLGRCVRYQGERRVNGETVLARLDVPTRICAQILAKVGERGLRQLNGIISAPTFRADGSLLNQPGYDEETGLLLIGEAFEDTPENPSVEQMSEAFTTLWFPFKDFPFVSDADRGVMLAALLTAFVRRSLPFAPAISFDAPQAGSGKTLLALCILCLLGMTPEALPDCGGDEELRKTLLSALREGKPGLLLDNIKGTFGSSPLEAFLTIPSFKGRVLGATQMLSFPTNVMLLISGNNFMPKGDLWRRILTTRIDAKTDAPERRAFAINPLEYCRRHRQQMVRAGLILLRGFIAAGKPRDKGCPDRLASFEAWDDLIRQCVIWIGKLEIAQVSDPTACIRVAKEREPERVKLHIFLDAVARVFKRSPWRTAELFKKADNDTELYNCLSEIAAERGKLNSRMFGHWLARQADVRCGGKRLVRAGTSHHVATWRIEIDYEPDADLHEGGSRGSGGYFQANPEFSHDHEKGFLNGRDRLNGARDTRAQIPRVFSCEDVAEVTL